MTRENVKVYFNREEETYSIDTENKGDVLLFKGDLTDEQVLVLEDNTPLKQLGMFIC